MKLLSKRIESIILQSLIEKEEVVLTHDDIGPNVHKNTEANVQTPSISMSEMSKKRALQLFFLEKT